MTNDIKLRQYLIGFVVVAIILLTGCGDSSNENIDKSENKDSKAFEHVVCDAPKGRELTTIQSLVSWINALPKPTTLPCLLESLPRPLYISMTTSTFSAQPSVSDVDPRVFIFLGDLIISIVTDYDQHDIQADGTRYSLLEISYLTKDINDIGPNEDILSVKGELVFPVPSTLLPEAPHQQVSLDFTDEVSACGLCHLGSTRLTETAGDSKTAIYQSVALKPFDKQRFSLGSLYKEHNACESSTSSYRCAMLSSLLDHGAALEKDFPAQMMQFGSSIKGNNIN